MVFCTLNIAIQAKGFFQKTIIKFLTLDILLQSFTYFNASVTHHKRRVFPFNMFAFSVLKPRANGRNIVGQHAQQCWMLHVASVCTPCCMLLDVVAQSLKPVKLFSQQLPTFLLFRDRWSVAQQCWIRLHSSSNIIGATHAHYAWITKTYGLYSSHDALQVPNLLEVVASVGTPLPTRTQP